MRIVKFLITLKSEKSFNILYTMKKITTLLFGALFLCMSAIAQETPQVWDMGAEQFDDCENMLTADDFNLFYDESITPGSTGVTIPSGGFVIPSQNFVYSTGGASNHRHRTTNTAITRYDNKDRKDAAGNVYKGYIYSNTNNSSSPNVYVRQTFNVNDVIDYYVSSNGGAAEYHFVAPDESEQIGNYTASAQCEKLTFVVGQTGYHKLYCAQGEKLCVARIVRQPATYVMVTGSITAPAGFSEIEGTKVVFENTANGWIYEASIVDGAYTAWLPADFEFAMSISGAPSYSISNGRTVEVTSYLEHDIELMSVDLVTTQGSVIGLDAASLERVEFEFTISPDKVYVPELVLDRTTGAFTLTYEAGESVVFTANNVNDYMGETRMNGDGTIDFVFTALPTYPVTIVPTGATLSDLAEAVFTFTNLDEEGYVYSFTGPDNIMLRDGRYSVKVTNTGIYKQLLTSNFTVSLAPVSKQIDFSADVSQWVFNEEDFINGGYSSTGETYTYKTLVFTGCRSHNNTYLYGSSGTIQVPVSGNCNIIVSACYEYNLTVNGEVLANASTGSTSQIDEFTYTYTGGEGTVTIIVAGSSYINAIRVETNTEYRSELHVGAGQEFETINDALAYARKMPDVQTLGVTLLIEPGNYEEMLIIDIANLKMKNASATPSIALADGGLNIDPNAVRITSYYGVGYNYASMNEKYLWDARYQQVGIENYAPTVENPGNGGTASMWNATVRVEAANFRADNIIFENSFNQYVSAKEAADLLFVQSSMPVRPTVYGSLDVQARNYRERACAISFNKNADRGLLNNCRIVGRQDAIYGAEPARVAVNGGVLMGAVDYIFGGMTLACRAADLSMLVTSNNNDATYITAAQQNSGKRGFLFYDCHIVSAVPEVEMAETQPAKPGYFGRPWSQTGEAVFMNTTIDATGCTGYSGSLINPIGWNSSLGGESPRSYEYGTRDAVDNSANRASWATVLAEPILPDGTAITLFNFTKGSDNWDPFAEFTTALQEIGSTDDIALTVRDGRITIEGINANAQVEIYNAVGQMVCQQRATAMWTSPVMPLGMYIVTVNDNGRLSAAKAVIR